MSLNIDLINGPQCHYSSEEGETQLATEEAQNAQSQAFQEHLGVEEETLKAKTYEIDPKQLQEMNERFLHETVTLNGLHAAYNSAKKQNTVSYKGEEAWRGSDEYLRHANREVTLDIKDHILSESPAPVPPAM